MRSLGSFCLALSTTLAFALAPTVTWAEGTAQLGANQNLHQDTMIQVDVLTAGEVINISAGNDSIINTSAVSVTVLDPSNTPVAGSPFTIQPGSPGWLATPDVLPPTTIAKPLQVTASVVGTYTVRFNNTNVQAELIDPFDITVTPTATTPVQPAAPPGGFSRVHSKQWRIEATAFTKAGATDAAFYVLTDAGPTWLLKFNGLAGYVFEVQGNEVGLPAPNSGFSIDESKAPVAGACDPGYQIFTPPSGPKVCLAIGPAPQFKIYLGVPDVAQGINLNPTVSNFTFQGPNGVCKCAVASLEATFTFDTNVVGTYQLVIDINNDGLYDPSGGDVVLAGKTVSGTNTVKWDGNDNTGQPAPAGQSYKAQISVRVGEFHFVGRDIETAKPGLRIFHVDPSNKANIKITSTKMYWNDSRIATTAADGTQLPLPEQSVPASALPLGIDSGNPTNPPVCGNDALPSQTVNAHCWGNFNPTGRSAGNERYIDTWVFASRAETTAVTCIDDGTSDIDKDGLTLLQECSGKNPTDPNKGDTDGDGLLDGVEKKGSTDPNKADTDGDGLLDGVEDKNRNGVVDPDETDPSKADTDGDGLSDGVEDKNRNGVVDPGETDPLKDDTDGDAITDGAEDKNRNGVVDPGELDPTKSDTDGDGLSDGAEDKNKDGRYDPTTETDGTKADTDGDGLGDALEDTNRNGVVDPGETDPKVADTDGDGLSDGEEDTNKDGELSAGETDPNKADTDGDGLVDGIEKGKNKDGSAIAGATLTDPLKTDTDGDGLLDGEEDINKDGKVSSDESDPSKADTDGDGLGDGIEKGKNKDGSAIVDANTTDPTKADTDGDGIKDGVEDANKDGKYDKGVETDPNLTDSDGDGLVDGWRDENGDGKKQASEGEDLDLDGKVGAAETDPRKADTDGGGESDFSEVTITGHNPRDDRDDRPDSFRILGGGGCAIAASDSSLEGAGSFALLGLMLVFGVVLRRRKRAVMQRGCLQQLKRFMVGAVCLLILSSSSMASAQNVVGFPVQNFRPGPSSTSYYVTENGILQPHLRPSVQLWFNFARRPLQLIDNTQDSRVADIVSWRVNMDLMASISFWSRLELGIALPVVLAQGTESLTLLNRPVGETLSASLGDLRLVPKVRIATGGPATLAIGLNVTFPTGDPESLMGNDGVTFAPRVILSFDTAYFDLALNVGYRLRNQQSFNFTPQQRIVIDDETFASVGMAIAFWREHLDLIVDAWAAIPTDEQDAEEVPVEIMGGLRAHFTYGFIANVAAGGGITRGVGAPQFRIMWGIGWLDKKVVDLDPDKDGILGNKDLCPLKPEDKDGFKDEDGCPDPDNDKDGILDIHDKCPNMPEDKDGFADKDGCPDPDNDKDGIPDKLDRCPLKPEDKNGYQDDDGCPDGKGDRDKDGIPDRLDRCPDKPEDKDGFADKDGCPDPDNDKDGILDAKDKCPDEAETKNGFLDDDG